jgi:hypothetical protein
MKSDEAFEQRLKRVPLKPMPKGLRDEILSAAHGEAETRNERRNVSWREMIVGLFWPHPRAWVALGGAWVVIVMLNLQLRDAVGPALAQRPNPPPPQLEQARQQKAQLYAELGLASLPEADRPKKVIPRPRTDRASELATV